MAFAVSITWREPTNHLTDSLFCKVSPIQKGVTKRQWSIQIYHRLFVQCLAVNVCLFQNSPPVVPWTYGKEENTPEDTPYPSTSREPKFFLNVISADTHTTIQKELSDLSNN
jgi:hypothetical protein